MTTTTAWRCDVCGYVHEGDAPPDICPVCGATADMFSPMTVTAGDTAPATVEERRIVVLGGGIAGLTAAEHARKLAPDSPITLIVHPNEGLPYYRLNLSRLIAGEVESSSLEIKDAAWFSAQRIELLRAEATAIEPDASRIQLAEGEPLPFDRLVLATGATAFVPPIPGAEKAGVCVLRTHADAEDLIARIGPGRRCVCIGGGLLGLEAAGGIARRGVAVTVLETAPSLLPRQLATPGGKLLERNLRELGLDFRCGAKIEQISGDEAAQGVLLAGGEQLAADFVLVAAGVRPDVRLAKAAGLTVNKGVVVDDTLASSDARIFAAGDVAEHRGVLYGIWPTAYAQGVVAGRNAAGARDQVQALTPSNRLKVVSLPVLSIGNFNAADDTTLFERETSAAYIRLLHRDGRLLGANLVGETGLDTAVTTAVESQKLISDFPELVSLIG